MSGKRSPKGKFHPLVWFGESKYLGLLSSGLWFEGPLIFPDFGLLCRKQNGATIHPNFFFFFCFVFLIETAYRGYTYLKLAYP